MKRRIFTIRSKDIIKHLTVFLESQPLEPGFAAMIKSVRNVHTLGYKAESKAMASQIVKMTSTTGATTKQFTEYLKEIERDMIGKGIVLPHPEDRYYSAMGIKQQKHKQG